MGLRPRRKPIALKVETLAKGEQPIVYRVVKTAAPAAADFEESFKSRAALGLPPRQHTVEGDHPELARGISVFATREAAAGTARAVRRRGRDLGGFVARLIVTGDGETKFARWGSPGHLTIWGGSLKLAQSAVDIFPIDDPGDPP